MADEHVGMVGLVGLVILGGCIVVLLTLGVRWVVDDLPRPVNVVLGIVAAGVLATAAVFIVALFQWKHDSRVCDAHWAGSSGESVACMEARQDSRWGPWEAFGPTANIIHED